MIFFFCEFNVFCLHNLDLLSDLIVATMAFVILNRNRVRTELHYRHLHLINEIKVVQLNAPDALWQAVI